MLLFCRCKQAHSTNNKSKTVELVALKSNGRKVFDKMSCTQVPENLSPDSTISKWLYCSHFLSKATNSEIERTRVSLQTLTVSHAHSHSRAKPPPPPSWNHGNRWHSVSVWQITLSSSQHRSHSENKGCVHMLASTRASRHFPADGSNKHTHI